MFVPSNKSTHIYPKHLMQKLAKVMSKFDQQANGDILYSTSTSFSIKYTRVLSSNIAAKYSIIKTIQLILIDLY